MEDLLDFSAIQHKVGEKEVKRKLSIINDNLSVEAAWRIPTAEEVWGEAINIGHGLFWVTNGSEKLALANPANECQYRVRKGKKHNLVFVRG